MALIAGRREIGASEKLDALSVRLRLKDGTGFATGKSPILIVINPDGTKLTLTSNAFAEVNATDMPGLYEITVPSSDFTQLGVHQLRVDPVDALVDEPDGSTVNRLSAPSTSAPSGANLCTLADVNALIGTTSAAQDAVINSTITRTSAFIERFCRRKFAQQALTEKHDGDGGDILFLRNPPIQSLTTVTIATVSKDVTKFEISSGDNSGFITSESFTFDAGRNKVTVVYQGGFAVLPQEIVGLCARRVAIEFRLIDRRKLGLTGEQAPDGSRTFISDRFTQTEEDILEPYVLRWGTMAVA